MRNPVILPVLDLVQSRVCNITGHLPIWVCRVEMERDEDYRHS